MFFSFLCFYSGNFYKTSTTLGRNVVSRGLDHDSIVQVRDIIGYLEMQLPAG
jgi:hypothetical protein